MARAKASHRIADGTGMVYDFLLAVAVVGLLLSPLMIDAYPSRELRRRIRARRQRAIQQEEPMLVGEAAAVSRAPERVRVHPRNVLKWLFLQPEAVRPKSSGKSA
ncbi:MAG: hypothetical protein ACP5E5_03395 [Acidobacteriaceae bacterium]